MPIPASSAAQSYLLTSCAHKSGSSTGSPKADPASEGHGVMMPWSSQTPVPTWQHWPSIPGTLGPLPSSQPLWDPTANQGRSLPLSPSCRGTLAVTVLLVAPLPDFQRSPGGAPAGQGAVTFSVHPVYSTCQRREPSGPLLGEHVAGGHTRYPGHPQPISLPNPCPAS